ncbi:GNAT family N-acetyltransferase [Pseudomonas anatoliensis]|uniref:GNAT family N-acetyltransferase n=1 Tax=Pseudomonas anatoliensis TaxID=2710589 RepID=UPI001B3200C9|nr:GNAT family N-acetyltransferase [Pseudomonas anatoliensis]MBP5958546.1 GNAT family N-acetyltransferase [Pseudomonas anatoliensis]
MFELKEISIQQEIYSAALQERYHKGSSPKTHDFIALSGDAEAGLLIYEDWGHPEGFIHEIFVLSNFRKRGIGNWLLSQAEGIAAELGNTKIRLDARSLDWSERTHEELACWYESKGYVRVNTDVGTLEKIL